MLHFLIHLPLISTKEIFCTAGREVGCLCFGFLFKMGDSDNLSSGEAPEKPIKNSDIFFILFTEEGRNHYYYSGKKDFMTHINKLFSNLSKHTIQTSIIRLISTYLVFSFSNLALCKQNKKCIRQVYINYFQRSILISMWLLRQVVSMLFYEV